MLYQRLPGAPPKDLFNWFAGMCVAATLVMLVYLTGGSWERVLARMACEAELYEQIRPYSSTEDALKRLGPPQRRIVEDGFSRLQYDRVEGLPGGAELWIDGPKVLRLFSLESPEHRAAMQQSLANRRR